MATIQIFDADNALGAEVWDVEASRKLEKVAMVVVEDGNSAVVCLEDPPRLHSYGIAVRSERFQTIYPIYGGGAKPVLFHCYGRQL